MSALVDQWGRPLQKELLTQEVAGPSVTGVRSPYSGYPADGLNPSRLANILREADQGEPLGYYELAETIEERDLHYAGVLATRKRSVAQIDITVEAASDDARDVDQADMIREWLKRDELSDEIFDMMDAVGKGTSFTEVIWDSSMGQWQPQRLEWRDPRWFTWDRKTMRKPQLRGGIDGTEVVCDLPAFKFIRTDIKAKSGLPVRSGIARIAAWAWMFKAFTQRDWAIFSQTYGQPVRVGKFHEGATKGDKATLFRAVANIAGDCAAIIPQSMSIDFIESKNVTAGSDLYEKRADWLDRQISKAILGQTNTTDAQSGGLGSGQAQVHDGVREDIETADCKALSAAINRDLIRPWIDLEYGPQRKYPRLVIARPKQEDIQQLTASLEVLVPLGMRVSASEVRDKLGLSDPGESDELLSALARSATPVDLALNALEGSGSVQKTALALHSEEPATQHPADQIADAVSVAANPGVEQMVTSIQSMLDHAQDIGEFRVMLNAAYGLIDSTVLASALAGGIAAAQAAGRSDLVDEAAK